MLKQEYDNSIFNKEDNEVEGNCEIVEVYEIFNIFVQRE